VKWGQSADFFRTAPKMSQLSEEKMAKIAIPEKVETERLTLRRYRREDSAGIVELVRDNREQLIREFAAMTNLHNLDQAAPFVRQKERGKQIGQIQMKNVAWEIPAAELSYFIDREFRQKGFATESIRANPEFSVPTIGISANPCARAAC
jgi:RimJ/RimL family protein N-acetyltransferase